MYRCGVCDNPAQMKCSCANELSATQADFHQAMRALKNDPWGWKEQDEKLDIQAGVKVKKESN